MPSSLPLLRTQGSREYSPRPRPWFSFPPLSPTLLPRGSPSSTLGGLHGGCGPDQRTNWQRNCRMPGCKAKARAPYHRLQGSVQGCQDNAPLPASWRATLDAPIFLHPAWVEDGGVSDLRAAELQRFCFSLWLFSSNCHCYFCNLGWP